MRQDQDDFTTELEAMANLLKIEASSITLQADVNLGNVILYDY